LEQIPGKLTGILWQRRVDTRRSVAPEETTGGIGARITRGSAGIKRLRPKHGGAGNLTTGTSDYYDVEEWRPSGALKLKVEFAACAAATGEYRGSGLKAADEALLPHISPT